MTTPEEMDVFMRVATTCKLIGGSLPDQDEPEAHERRNMLTRRHFMFAMNMHSTNTISQIKTWVNHCSDALDSDTGRNYDTDGEDATDNDSSVSLSDSDEESMSGSDEE